MTDLRRTFARLQRFGADLRQASAELRRHHAAESDPSTAATWHRLALVCSEVSENVITDIARIKLAAS